ncbi:Uncharacterised protein [uncultured archaeon]|nr:Uncharacterised protein [uncultured archaeon]
MRHTKIILAMLLTMLLMANTVCALPDTQSPSVAAYLQKNIVKFLNQGSGNTVSYVMVTNSNSGVVTYTVGTETLKYDKNAGTLTGVGKQYFSDRWTPATPGDVLSGNPFNAKKTDPVTLVLNVNDGSVSLVKWTSSYPLHVPDSSGLFGDFITGQWDFGLPTPYVAIISFQKHGPA